MLIPRSSVISSGFLLKVSWFTMLMNFSKSPPAAWMLLDHICISWALLP